MKQFINLNIGKRSIGLGILAVLLGVWLAGTGAAWYKKISQSKKQIEKAKHFLPVPIELVEIKDKKNTPLVLSKQFQGDDEWLKGMEFKLKNVFPKDMIYIELALNFPETKVTGNEMTFPIRFGKVPLTNEIEDVPVLKPDEETTLKVDEQTYSRLKQFLETRHPIETLTHLTVDIRRIFFSDHTGWYAGNFYIQDPANPGHFINVGESLPQK